MDRTGVEEDWPRAADRGCGAKGLTVVQRRGQCRLGRQEQRALNREFRRFATAARKLEQAVARPMCVGVFGPSQAGKSYLVSVLARPGEKPLIADFDGQGIDFIAEINPEGGKESTGLVTRFSLTRQAHPPGFPVCLRLLSERT